MEKSEIEVNRSCRSVWSRGQRRDEPLSTVPQSQHMSDRYVIDLYEFARLGLTALRARSQAAETAPAIPIIVIAMSGTTGRGAVCKKASSKHLHCDSNLYLNASSRSRYMTRLVRRFQHRGLRNPRGATPVGHQ